MPERQVILDTSFLRRFTMTGRVDLLAAYADAVVTRRVVGEHSTVVPPEQHRLLLTAIRDTPLVEKAWFDLVSAGRIQLDHQNLSNTDASLVAAAQKTGYTLVTADDGIYRACLAMKVPVQSLVGALVQMAEVGWFDADALEGFVTAVEKESQYTFGAPARKLLDECKAKLRR